MFISPKITNYFTLYFAVHCIMVSHSSIFEILLEMFAGIFELKNKANI